MSWLTTSPNAIVRTLDSDTADAYRNQSDWHFTGRYRYERHRWVAECSDGCTLTLPGAPG